MSGPRDIHSVQQTRDLIDQLRREKATTKRERTSQCAMDLVKYCQDFQREDHLIIGFASENLNPFPPRSNFQCRFL